MLCAVALGVFVVLLAAQLVASGAVLRSHRFKYLIHGPFTLSYALASDPTTGYAVFRAPLALRETVGVSRVRYLKIPPTLPPSVRSFAGNVLEQHAKTASYPATMTDAAFDAKLSSVKAVSPERDVWVLPTNGEAGYVMYLDASQRRVLILPAGVAGAAR
jgi:hypothetical protein